MRCLWTGYRLERFSKQGFFTPFLVRACPDRCLLPPEVQTTVWSFSCFFFSLTSEAFHNMMGKGPAVIRLIECWKPRQEKWLEIISVLKADTDSSFSLSPHFWELLSSSPGAHRSWVLLEPGGCLLRYLPKLCCLSQPFGTNQLLLLPRCAYGMRQERRGAQVSMTAAHRLPGVPHGYWGGNLLRSFHRDTQNTEYFQIWQQ